jgi:hypothetical protein
MPVARKARVTTFSPTQSGTAFEAKNPMLALFLNHPPMFVAGEIALGLSLALFIGALIVAIGNRASEVF